MTAPRSSPRSRQAGISLVFYVIGILAVLAMAGLALDLGTAYVARTRLQNALDSAALAGAYTLNQQFSSTLAQTDAVAAFNQNSAGLPDGTVPVIEVSNTLVPAAFGAPAAGVSSAKYLRATVTGMPSPVLLSTVVGVPSTLSLGARAVAGPLPTCVMVPVAVCGSPGDTDCSDGKCYGLGPGSFTIKGSSTSSKMGPGNYGLMDYGCSGADCVRDGLAGAIEACVSTAGKISTEPGVVSGPSAAGINTRFGQYAGSLSSGDYPPDVVTQYSPELTYAQYQAKLAAGAYDTPGGVAQRRVIASPVVNCSPPISGKKKVNALGTVCLFLRKPVDGSGANAGYMTVEVAPSCLSAGGRIALYQDTSGG